MYAVNLTSQTYTLDASKQVAGVEPELFRHTLAFSLNTGSLADEIVVVEASVGGRFASYEYTLPGSALGSLGSAVEVTLPAPRRIQRINVNNSAFGSDPHQIELYRIDVKAIAPEPTLTVNNNANLSDDFSDVHLALMRQEKKSLSPSQVSELRVVSQPASPRLGLVIDGSLDDVVYFWQGTDEIEGADLGGTLTRFLARRLGDLADAGQPKPAQLDVTLVLESRAPCQVQIDTLRVDYRLAVESWTDSLPARDSEKRVLRFARDRLDSQSISLALPPTLTVHSATLRAIESQAQAPLQAAPDGAGAVSALASPAPAEKNGLHTTPDHWIAQVVQPQQAQTVQRLVLGLLPLVEGVELAVALQESWQDQPSGSDLAAGTLQLGTPGRAMWATLNLPGPLTLSTQPYWLMLKTTKGQAVWLARTGTQTTKIWQRPDGKRTWTQIRDLSGYQLLYQFLSPQSTPAPAAAEVPQAPAETTCRLMMGTQTLTPASRDGDSTEYDLAVALSAYLKASQSPPEKGFATFGGGATTDKGAETLVEGETVASAMSVEIGEPIPIPLTFSAIGLKQITVFPPRIEYSPQSA
jgi:hypothetical protein